MQTDWFKKKTAAIMEGLEIPMLILKLLFRRLMRTDQEQLNNVPLHLRTLQEKLGIHVLTSPYNYAGE